MKTIKGKYKVIKDIPGSSTPKKGEILDLIEGASGSYMEKGNWDINGEDISKEFFVKIGEKKDLISKMENLNSKMENLNSKLTDKDSKIYNRVLGGSFLFWIILSYYFIKYILSLII